MEKKNKIHSKEDLLQKKKRIVFVVFVFAFLVLSKTGLSGENIFKDSDQDGLSDREEIALGTDPNNSDTDGDGYSDGVEMASGYDPLVSAPGDRLIKEPEILGEKSDASSDEGGSYNLTKEFLEKVKSDETPPEGGFDEDAVDGEGEFLTENDLEKIRSGEIDVEAILDEVSQEAESETKQEGLGVSREDINIIPKPSGTEEEIREKEKKQIEEYFAEVLYVLAENKPFQLSEDDDLLSGVEAFAGQVNQEIQGQDLRQIENYQGIFKDVFEQIKTIEVPEAIAENHIKSLNVLEEAYSGIDPKKLLSEDDPLALYSYMGKMQSALIAFEEIQRNFQEIQEEYGLDSINMSILEIEN